MIEAEPKAQGAKGIGPIAGYLETHNAPATSRKPASTRRAAHRARIWFSTDWWSVLTRTYRAARFLLLISSRLAIRVSGANT
jgi:hypothetical protein